MQWKKHIDDEPPKGYFDDKEEPFDNEESDDIPFVCRACGGPYPDCTDSCKIFEDS